jgi:protein-S-isoprenylcysteine O-methyltransferase Ste14
MSGAAVTPGRDARRDTAGVIAPPPLIYLAGLGLGLLLEALLPGASLTDLFSGGHGDHIAGVLRWTLGGSLLVAGVALMAWWVASFRRAETPMPPWEPTTALVTSGPYLVSRNPAYLSDALIYIAVAVLADALWVLLPLPLVLLVMQQGVIKREERYLERRFGQGYLDFKARRRRWL